MKDLNKEDAIFILHSLIDNKNKALAFYEKMPLQEKVKNQVAQEVYNLNYVLEYIESL